MTTTADNRYPIEADALLAYEWALTEAARAESPAAAARSYIRAWFAALMGGDLELAGRAARLAHEAAPASDDGLRAQTDLALARYELAHGPRARGRKLADGAARLVPGRLPADLACQAGFMLTWLEQYEAAQALLEAAVDTARTRGDPWLATALDTLAALDLRTGRWQRSRARSAEAMRIALIEGQHVQAASGHASLARLAAARGDGREVRSHLSAVAQLVPTGSLVWGYGVTAGALLELGLGRPEEAASQLAVLAASDTAAEPSLFDWEADWIEALIRHGRGAEASEALDGLAERAARSRRPSALAGAARCRGLIASPSRFDEHFEQALRIHQTVPTPFDRARTELCYGERLRGSRRVREARPLVQAALSTFERLGAAPWAARAQRQLSAPRWSRPGAVNPNELLTVRELEVASLVARGARNREAAAALFVSEKTVEYHLTAIYGKLGVRSRTELTRRLLQ